MANSDNPEMVIYDEIVPRFSDEPEQAETTGNSTVSDAPKVLQFLNVPSSVRVEKQNDEDDVTHAASKGMRRSMSVFSDTSLSSNSKTKPKYEYKLMIVVAVLFCVIVVGVVVIYQFYNRYLYMLELGQRIYFDEIDRTLSVTDEDGKEVLRGELALTLPNGMLPRSCDRNGSDSCIEWRDKARVYIDYEETDHVHCYHIHWTSIDQYVYPYDCYELGSAHWYGGVLPIRGPFQNATHARKPFMTSTVNAPDGLGPVIEPYWLTSRNVALYVEGNPPLHIEVNQNNDGRFCLVSLYVESPYANRQPSPWLDYTVCTGPNMRDMHRFMLRRMDTGQRPQPPPLEKFSRVVYSTWSRFKDNVNQDGVLDYVQNIVDDQLAKGIILFQEGWQSAHGDLTFDPVKFPNSTYMINEIRSKGFEVGVAVTHMTAVDSQAFQERIRSDSLVKDAGGVTEGLVDYYIGPHTSSWHQTHSAAIDFTSPNVGSPYDGVTVRLGVQHLMYEGGQVDLLPYRPHFSADYASPNQYVADYLTHQQSEDPWTNIQAAYRNQHVDRFVQLYDANCTDDQHLNGLQSVLPQAIALGIMGYPYLVPSAIGGSHYPPLSSPLQKLYKRWVQLVTFLPVMHFGSLPQQYDQGTINMVNRYTDLHKTDIVPLIESIKHNVTSQLEPIVRPLWWYDPYDDVCVKTLDQFMVGDELLVAPVLDDSSKSRDVYLPTGRWLDENLQTTHDGPQWLVEYPANDDVIPYFRRVNV